MPLNRSNVVGMIEIARDATLYDPRAILHEEPQHDTRLVSTRAESFARQDRLRRINSSPTVEANLPRLRDELVDELQTFLDRLHIAS